MATTPTTPGMGYQESLYRGAALAQLRILKQQMQLGGLNTARRSVKLDNGVVVECSICFNNESVVVHIPPPESAAAAPSRTRTIPTIVFMVSSDWKFEIVYRDAQQQTHMPDLSLVYPRFWNYAYYRNKEIQSGLDVTSSLLAVDHLPKALVEHVPMTRDPGSTSYPAFNQRVQIWGNAHGDAVLYSGRSRYNEGGLSQAAVTVVRNGVVSQHATGLEVIGAGAIVSSTGKRIYVLACKQPVEGVYPIINGLVFYYGLIGSGGLMTLYEVSGGAGQYAKAGPFDSYIPMPHYVVFSVSGLEAYCKLTNQVEMQAIADEGAATGMFAPYYPDIAKFLFNVTEQDGEVLSVSFTLSPVTSTLVSTSETGDSTLIYLVDVIHDNQPIYLYQKNWSERVSQYEYHYGYNFIFNGITEFAASHIQSQKQLVWQTEDPNIINWDFYTQTDDRAISHLLIDLRTEWFSHVSHESQFTSIRSSSGSLGYTGTTPPAVPPDGTGTSYERFARSIYHNTVDAAGAIIRTDVLAPLTEETHGDTFYTSFTWDDQLASDWYTAITAQPPEFLHDFGYLYSSIAVIPRSVDGSVVYEAVISYPYSTSAEGTPLVYNSSEYDGIKFGVAEPGAVVNRADGVTYLNRDLFYQFITMSQRSIPC